MTLTFTTRIALQTVFVFVSLFTSTAMAGDAELLKKCKVDVTWSRNGEDAVVVVTVTNKTKKKLVDPGIRVTFFDAEGNQVASDAKTYFKTIGPGAKKKLEGRIFSYIPTEAKKATAVVESGDLN